MQNFDWPRRLAAEALGTGLLVATVVGSSIMAESLTKDGALALLSNTLPTGAILVMLITDIRRAFQSRRQPGLCPASRAEAWMGAVVHSGAGCRRDRWNHARACDVRAAAARSLTEDPNRCCAMAGRRRRRLRSGRDHP